MEHLRGRRVWVTGAGGFVGRHLVARLQQAGVEVTPTDHDLDMRDAPLVAATLGRLAPDAVVHLAALSSVAASAEAALETYEVNFLGSRALLAGALEQAPKTRILLVGSGTIYGSAEPGTPPFAEDAPLRPQSPYAWSKACADLLGGHYAAQGLDVVRVRPFNHTGAGQSDVFAASSFARQLAEMETGRREPILRVGNLNSVRDFLPIDDVIDAYVALLDPAGAPAGAYNVASGHGLPIRALLEALLERARVRPQIQVDTQRLRPTDVAVGDAARLDAVTGWKPRADLGAALDALLDGWRAQT